MIIDKEETKQFYERYLPCTCSDCKLYIKHIESLYPELCEGLRDFGVNPQKPYELISFYHLKEKQMEYATCVYLIVGKIEEEFKKIIGGFEITVASQDHYPDAFIQKPYFFLTFGPIHIQCVGTSNRHICYDQKLKLILQAINEIDPMNLLSLDCPKDEYVQEAKLILEELQMKKSIYLNWKKIRAIFFKQFDQELPYKICLELAKRIAIYFDFKDYIRDFEEIEELKGKVTIKDKEIILKVHDNFIVKFLIAGTITIFINDKLYINDLEEQDLLYFMCEFVRNDDVVYIQYKHKHFGLFYHPKFYYFKEIKRKKWSWSKVKHFNDIELVFDNKRVLYWTNDAGKLEINEEKIIEHMIKESIPKSYELGFLSPNKKKRLFVIKNSAGSYSYYINLLHIVDPDEILYFDYEAYWEPDLRTTASFYDSIESLLTDIHYIIKDWEKIE